MRVHDQFPSIETSDNINPRRLQQLYITNRHAHQTPMGVFSYCFLSLNMGFSELSIG